MPIALKSDDPSTSRWFLPTPGSPQLSLPCPRTIKLSSHKPLLEECKLGTKYKIEEITFETYMALCVIYDDQRNDLWSEWLEYLDSLDREDQNGLFT